MKIVGLLTVTITAVLLLFAVKDFPDWADPYSPASRHISPYYIENTIEETSVPNVVTSVLADYRGFDTMFETAVIFTAGIAVIYILRRIPGRRDTGPPPEVDLEFSYENMIVQMVSRLMIPFMQLYALYVVAHGHHSPGGGFQGGVILGASFILLAISYNLKASLRRMSERANGILNNLGVLIYSGIGALCVILGANFLDYGVLSRILPDTDSVRARSHGILGVEIGVAISVMAIMIVIYMNITSNGKYDKGL